MDYQGVTREYEGEPVTVVPFVDGTFQALQQLIKEQVLAAQEQSAMAERRATEAERRNQELFAQLQRDTLATQASMQQAVTASVATITTWVAGQESRLSGHKPGSGTTPTATESESDGQTHRVRVLGVNKMDPEESDHFWREVGKGRLPGRHQRGHTAAYQAAVDRSTAKMRARERVNQPAPLAQSDSSGSTTTTRGGHRPITTSRSSTPVSSQSARDPPRQLEGGHRTIQ